MSLIHCGMGENNYLCTVKGTLPTANKIHSILKYYKAFLFLKCSWLSAILHNFNLSCFRKQKGFFFGIKLSAILRLTF